MYTPPTIEKVLEAEIREQVNKHKWILGERISPNPDFNYSLDDWIKNHFYQWAEWFVSKEADFNYELDEMEKYIRLTSLTSPDNERERRLLGLTWTDNYAKQWRNVRDGCKFLIFTLCLDENINSVREFVHFYVPPEKEQHFTPKTARHINTHLSHFPYEAHP